MDLGRAHLIQLRERSSEYQFRRVSPPCATGKLAQERLRVVKVREGHTFGEPIVDRPENFASFNPSALIAPEARQAKCRAKFPNSCILLPGAFERRRKALLRLLTMRPVGHQ